MSPDKPSAMLTDLPTEILQEIISHLDNDGLLQLGLTCKDTNTLALATFFTRNKLRPEDGLIVAYEMPIETLPALHAALFVKQLHEVDFYLNPNLDRLVGEVADLRSLVARLSSVDIVKVDFSVVDRWINTSGQVPEDRMERRMWEGLFARLLDAILGRSCTQLLVSGGDRLYQLYTPEAKPVNTQPPPVPVHMAASDRERRCQWSVRTMARRIFRRPTTIADLAAQMITATPEAKNPQGPINPPPENMLRELEIHSDMLLQSSFLDWTLSRVGAASATLTKLSFECTFVLHETWQTVFRTLSLPYLIDFTLCSYPVIYSCSARFVDVMDFLSRHPSLSIVRLHGVEVPVLAAAKSNSILPRITNLTARPSYVTHILRNAPDKLPLLSSVCISAESTSPSSVGFLDFDTSLHSIASFKFAGPITLGLRFQCRHGVDEWFAAHQESGSCSPLASLYLVTSLVIAWNWRVDLPYRVVAHFDEWLALFPSVEELEFTEQTDDHLMKCFLDLEFLKRLAAACPKLKGVSGGGKFVSVASESLGDVTTVQRLSLLSNDWCSPNFGSGCAS